MGESSGIRVEGVRELTRALNRAGGKDLTKAMGAANKTIGAEVIRRLQPLPESVGLGAGAKVRPSASARLVQLKAGGAFRANTNMPKADRSSSPYGLAQWGKKYKQRTGERPHIVGTAVRVFPDIEQTYMAGIDRALQGLGGVD